MAPPRDGLESFPAVLRRAWTTLRRLLFAAAALFVLGSVLAVVALHQVLSLADPRLAWMVTGVLSLALLVLPAAVVVRWVAMPRALVPPDLAPPQTGWTGRERERYRRFVVRYLERQRRNPHLDADARARIPGAIAAVRTFSSDPEDDPIAAASALDRHARAQVDDVLAPLDREARRIIRRSAIEVCLGSALSPSGLLDALIVGARNLDMIARLADLYYGRPGLGGMLRLVRDTVGSALTAGVLDVATNHLGGALAEFAGAWGSRLAGPFGQGAVNGLLTLRLGAAARARCRSLASSKVAWRPWSLADYRRALGALGRWVAAESGSRVGAPLRQRAGRARTLGTGIVSRILGRRTATRPVARAVAPRATAHDDDPLLGTDLLEG